VADDLVELGSLHLIGDLLGGKCPLAGCTPNIDAASVNDENPDNLSHQFPAQGIETQFVVGGNQHRRVLVRCTKAIQAGGNFIVITGKTGPGADGTKIVTQR